MTSPSNLVYLTDRTTIETEWECSRKRWWYKNHGERGIIPAKEADYFIDGREIHGDLAAINLGTPWEEVAEGLNEIAPTVTDPMPLRERWLRRLGWVTAYGLYLHPILADKYETVAVEKEMILVRGDLWIAFTNDWVVRSRATKKLTVFDFKGVGILGKSWAEHWPYAIQMHINIKGTEEELNEEVECAQVIGLRKGEEDRGKLRHPYVWAYSNGGDDADSWRPDYKYGWSLRCVSEYPGGPDAWVRRLGPEVGMAQFPFSLPISYDDLQFKRMIRERTSREQEVESMKDLCAGDEALKDVFFPHSFSKCRPSFGSPCPYVAACHNATVAADPVGSGLYVPRTPHHEIEITGVDE